MCTVARNVGSAATGRVKTSTEILALSLARLISLLFLSIRNNYECVLSSTHNEYYLIICSIKH